MISKNECEDCQSLTSEYNQSKSKTLHDKFTL